MHVHGIPRCRLCGPDSRRMSLQCLGGSEREHLPTGIPFSAVMVLCVPSQGRVSHSYLLPYSRVHLDDPRPPNSVALHPTLRHSIEDALKTRDYLRDPRSNAFYPIASEKDWRRIAYPGSSLSLDYHFMCSLCLASRLVRRADAPVVESLPEGYEFKCADVGVECSVEMLIPCEFLPRAYRSISNLVDPPS